ncbi:MAG: dihydroxyacetone kinase subunit DhaL [Geminicoccaceae bacterium]
MADELIAALIDRAHTAMADNAAYLTELDQAIGDGDHGINMKRGFSAILAEKDDLAGKAIGDALAQAGMKLVTTVGGASGPLYGSLIMGMGKAAKTGAGIEAQLAEGVAMVKKRGKSDVGAKTMLDVLVPVLGALEASQNKPLGERLANVRQVADQAHRATRDMVAKRGRASFLGERSKGHLDPGATSSRLLIHAVCDVLEAQG